MKSSDSPGQLAAWGAIFLAAILLRSRFTMERFGERVLDTSDGSGLIALLSWILGIVVGLLFTSTPWFSGPWAQGAFERSSLGFLIGFLVSGAAYTMGRLVLARAVGARSVGEGGTP